MQHNFPKLSERCKNQSSTGRNETVLSPRPNVLSLHTAGVQRYLQGGGPLQDLVLKGAVSRNLLQQLGMDGVRGQRLTQHDVMTAQQLKL